MRKVMMCIVCVLMICAMGCSDKKQTDNETTNNATINYNVTAPLLLEHDYHSIGALGDGTSVNFKRKSITNANAEYEAVLYHDDIEVKFEKNDDGDDCIVVNNKAKSVELQCATINVPIKNAYGIMVDIDRDGKDEIVVIYWYDDSKYGMYCLESDTLEKVNVIAPNGTMLTQQQAKDVNKAIGKFKETHNEYIYKWCDLEGAAESGANLNNDAEYFVMRMTEDGILEIDVACQGYPSGGLVYIVTVQIAYKDGEFVVDKVIFDARDRG